MSSVTPVLRLSDVVKRRIDGNHEHVLLDRLSLTVRAGSSVGVLGGRRSGKSTLLRLAAGIELADEGSVCVQGRDVARMSALERVRLLRGTVGLLDTEAWQPAAGETVIDHLVLALGSGCLTPAQARRRACAALEEAGIAGIALEATASLPACERARLMLARALVHSPRLLLVDEPGVIPRRGDRVELMALLHSVCEQREIALLVASEEISDLHGASKLISIGRGELVETDGPDGKPGVVVPFPDDLNERTSRISQHEAQ